jgi:hypothetical protein
MGIAFLGGLLWLGLSHSVEALVVVAVAVVVIVIAVVVVVAVVIVIAPTAG